MTTPPRVTQYEGSRSLPAPLLPKHKLPPSTKYSSRMMDDHHRCTSSSQATTDQVDVHLVIEPEHFSHHYMIDQNATEEHKDDESQQNRFAPAGQHMLMDIQNVDPGFLSDMKRVANSVVQTTAQSGLTLLSYHCNQRVVPAGVSCVGVLLESHFAVHTWPGAGILSLDLFTCGPASLLPLLPLLEDLFALPVASSLGSFPKPVSRWLYKKRGFREYSLEESGEAPDNPEGAEIEQFLLGWEGYSHKKVVATSETKFQEASVFEMSRSDTPLLRQEDVEVILNSDKKLYLDGVAQSSLRGLEPYHEALVHPALLSHPNPKRVAIIGGGEGATLREVLKHKTVETCAMLEIDQELVELARQHLLEWNDCSDLIPEDHDTTSSWSTNETEHNYHPCFDDPRAEMHYVDAHQWIMDRFGNGAVVDEKRFDVIIMDALDPSSLVPFSDVLYGKEAFVEALLNALTPSGLLVAQVGVSVDTATSQRNHPQTAALRRFTNLLQKSGAKTMKSFSEAHGEFFALWDFRVVFKDAEVAERWNSQAARVDLELGKRLVKTRSGTSPFHYFDGASQQSYQYPCRIQQTLFCARKPLPNVCTGTGTISGQSELLANHSGSRELFDPMHDRKSIIDNTDDLLLSVLKAGQSNHITTLQSSLSTSHGHTIEKESLSRGPVAQ